MALAEPLAISISQKQSSYQFGNPRHVYIWLVKEKETLPLEKLKVADISLDPYEYKGSFDDGALVITARVEIDETTQVSIRNLPLYFPVIRVGISDATRSMRQGRVLWSQPDDDRIRMMLVLVNEAYDEKKQSHAIFDPEFSNMQAALAIAGNRIAKLLELLESKGTLTKEETDGIFEVPEADIKERNERLYKVHDLDEWLGKD